MEEAEELIKPAIDPDLLKKYVAYARTNINPVLTEEAMKTILDFYVALREQGREKNIIPINARQLEAIIRLAEASARVRLSREVTKEDAERAIDLLRTSMEEVLKDQSTGEYDIDIMYTGVPKSKRRKMAAVEDIVRELTETKGKASFEDVLQRAQEIGIEKPELEEILDELLRKGIIMQPRSGFYVII